VLAAISAFQIQKGDTRVLNKSELQNVMQSVVNHFFLSLILDNPGVRIVSKTKQTTNCKALAKFKISMVSYYWLVI
jgi:hypothetical protein